MKTAFRIFGIILALIALLTCSMSAYRAQLDKEKAVTAKTEAQAQIAKYKEEAGATVGETKAYLDQQIAEAEKEIALVPAASTYSILSIFLGVLLALALAFAVFLFRINLKLTPQLLGAAIIITAVTYFISPDIARGPYGGMESRTLALLSGIPVILTGLLAFGIAKMDAPRIRVIQIN